MRLPNLLTVPGDPLAGCLLAAGTGTADPVRIVCAVLVSLFLYAAGVVLNDIVDLETDQRERPTRPLPSGKIRVRSAQELLAVLFVLAAAAVFPLGRTAWLVAVVLAAAIALYNRLLKKDPILGPAAMGACRGLSVLLGAAAMGRWNLPALAAALAITVYIGVLTALARRETQVPDRPRLIGILLSLLLPLQAALVLMSGNPVAPWIALCLFALWPANRVLNRYFYSS